MKQEENERFFTQEEFRNELNQNVNADVLERIKKDTTITSEKIVFSFYYISDESEKIDSLIDYLQKNEPQQQVIELNTINGIWELNCRTYPIKLDIDSINKWEEKMWGIGYQFDCKLDGWESITEPWGDWSPRK